MLNWAARYFPILRVLRSHVEDGEPVLEIGSGSFGLAHFTNQAVVGCDLTFPEPPERNMLPLKCNAMQLPFADCSFAAVVASDVLEHIAPEQRLGAIREALRVTRHLAIFGFPCGAEARRLDERFFSLHLERGLAPPSWLVEHMKYPFPERTLFDGFQGEWEINHFGNENVNFHDWLNRRELSRLWNYSLMAWLKLTPRLLEFILGHFDSAPHYRTVFVLVRKVA